MKLRFSKDNMDTSLVLNYALRLILRITFDAKDVPMSEWPVFWCVVANIIIHHPQP